MILRKGAKTKSKQIVIAKCQMKTEVRHENCLLIRKEHVEVEASESAQELAEAPQLPGLDPTVPVLNGKFPALLRLLCPGTRRLPSPTIA